MNIQAAVTRSRGAKFIIEPLILDEPQREEVRVHIAAVGVCHTDIAMRDQVFPVPLPIVLGHEGAGYIDAVGEGVPNFVPGDAVLMSYRSCGACPGWEALAETGVAVCARYNHGSISAHPSRECFGPAWNARHDAFSEINQAVRDSEAGACVKAVLVMP
jgi:aryl-alcohol dehydrogenase